MRYLKLVAASVGGGILMTAGLRLGEKLVGAARRERDSESFARAPNRAAEPALPDAKAINDLRGDLEEWVERSIERRMALSEAKLMAELERGQKQVVDRFAANLPMQVTERITRLEEEVGNQSAAISTLRECVMRTEASTHKLLGCIETFLAQRPAMKMSGVQSEKDQGMQEKSRSAAANAA